MSTSAVARSKDDDFLSQIWSISTTLTEEALSAASAKAKESGFDPDRGVVSLAESFINLSSARGTLEDAIEKQKLVQLPITVQKEMLLTLEAISKALQGLTAGVDETMNLTTAIEALNTSIWKYGLHNLSDQVLGYQKKLNQLKTQELQISRVLAQLESARGEAERAGAAAAEVERRKSEAQAILEQVKQSAGIASSLLDQIKDADTKSNALFATVQQNEKQSGELTASIKIANNDLLALDASIRKFYGEVDEYRRKITQTNDEASRLIMGSEVAFKKLTEDTTTKVDGAIQSLEISSKAKIEELTANVDAKISEANHTFSKVISETRENVTTFQTGVEGKLAAALEGVGTSSAKLTRDSEQRVSSLEELLAKRSEETIGANHKRTELLIEELAKLKEQISEQIQQATGFTLFGAFQARQNEIAKSKSIWVYAIGILVLISAGVTVWIAHEAQSYSAHSFAFWVKLSLTIPLGFAITFCTVQYSRERRLEEEYAFKSSISVSLNPYRDLVHSILEKDGQVDQTKYTDFVIGSVTNVFTSPTDRVFDSEKKPSLTGKTFKEAAEIIGTVVKAAK
jgi:hypothetical protein